MNGALRGAIWLIVAAGLSAVVNLCVRAAAPTPGEWAVLILALQCVVVGVAIEAKK